MPPPNVSIVDIVLTIGKEAHRIGCQRGLSYSHRGRTERHPGIHRTALVSMDYNGRPLSSIVDAQTTYIVGQMVKVLAWYDNESGYFHSMVDLAALVGGML